MRNAQLTDMSIRFSQSAGSVPPLKLPLTSDCNQPVPDAAKTPESKVDKHEIPTKLSFQKAKDSGTIEVVVNTAPFKSRDDGFPSLETVDGEWSGKLVNAIATAAGNSSFHLRPDRGVIGKNGMTWHIAPGERTDSPEEAAKITLSALPFKSLVPVDGSNGWHVVFTDVPTKEQREVTEKVVKHLLAVQRGVDPDSVKLKEEAVTDFNRKLPKETRFVVSEK